MKDPIERQAAINLLKKWADGYQYIETKTELAIKEFQELPSAQPEIVRCKGCKHYDDGLCRRWKYSHVTSEESFCSGAERREE